MALDTSLLFANQAALAQQGFLPAAPPPAGTPPSVTTLPPVISTPADAAPPVTTLPPVVMGPGTGNPLMDAVAPPPPAAPAPAPFVPKFVESGGQIVSVPEPAPAPTGNPLLDATIGAKAPAAPPAPVTQLAPVVQTAPAHPAPSFGGSLPAAPGGPVDKGAAVLLPGQQQQFANEIEAQKHHNAQDMEIAAANEAIRAEAANKAAAAEAAYQTALDTEAKEREEFKSYYDGEAAKLDADATRVANQKIDPSRMFHGEGGTWNSILAGVAMVFGAMGAAGTGGKNMGVEAIQKQVDRDVELQAKDLESQKGDVARKQSMLAQKYQLFGNMQAAKAATRIEGYKAAQRQIDAWATQQGGDVFAAKAAQAGDDFNRKIDRAKEDWSIGIEGAYKQKQAQMAAAAASAAAAAAAKAEEERKYWRNVAGEGFKKALDEYPGAQLVFDKKSGQPIGVVDPNGQLVYGKSGAAKGEVPINILGTPNAMGDVPAKQGVAVSAEAANKYNEDMAKINDALVALAEMRKLREKNGGGKVIASSEDKAKAADLKRRLFTGAKTLGENSDNDAKRIEAVIPDPLATDATAAVMGGKSYTDTLIDQQEQNLLAKKQRIEALYLKPGQVAPPAATLAAPVK